MTFTLSALPFEMNALEPQISKETLEYHYGKHHQAYVNKLNALLEDSDDEASLEALIKTTSGAVFNNAAQIWNHNFYWQCLTPNKNMTVPESLQNAITTQFGSIDEFKIAFTNKALSNFGSGWTWLVKNEDGTLEIVNTSNAGNPLTNNQKPLLTCDVWEHAYYIDYRNARANYLENFWMIVNWEFVGKRFAEMD